MDIKIGDRIKNKINGNVEICSSIKHGYVNNFRADLWEIVYDPINSVYNLDELDKDTMEAIIAGYIKWNKKFYGNLIYLNNKAVKVTYAQKEYISQHLQIEF